MKPDFMQGKWRLPGRGRRLACGMGMTGITRFVPFSFYARHAKPCRWCGQTISLSRDGSVGRIERILFVEMNRHETLP